MSSGSAIAWHNQVMQS